MENKTFAVLCAKCIAVIGLCYSFVNDSVRLKASNSYTSQEIVENPSEKPKPKQARDNTLDLLAVPNFKIMPVERKDFVSFAEDVVGRVETLSMETEECPKDFCYSLFLLD